jgi:hypothetical protein
MRPTIPERAARESGCHEFATIDRRRAILARAQAHFRLLQWQRTNNKERPMKIIADFSFAAAAALAIGIAIGGSAFSLVWLIAALNA